MAEPLKLSMAESLRQPTFRPENPILRYFNTNHLPPILAEVAETFKTLAIEIEKNLPPGPEKSVCLRKLLESKEAAVRSALDLN